MTFSKPWLASTRNIQTNFCQCKVESTHRKGC